MSITTYAELQTAVGNWLARDDLSSYVPDFITLFESVANRRLRVRQMETTATLTPSSGAATLPTDYLAWRRLTWNGSTSRELEFVHPTYLRAAYPSADAGTPRIFTIEGSTLSIRPTDGTTLTMDYFQKIPVLSASNTTNWLLTAHPDVYLWGAMVEAHVFAKDAESAAVFKLRRDEAFAEIEVLSNRTVGPAAIRTMGVVV